MDVLFEKARRYAIYGLLMGLPLVLAASIPVTASGQTNAIAADEGAGVLLARFHNKRPPKIKKAPKPPPPPQKVAVPPVLNLSVSNAKNVLRRAGLDPRVVSQRTTYNRSRRNTVARQNPGAGALVNRGARVNLTRYRLKVKVPNIVNKPLPAAKTVISGADLRWRVESHVNTSNRAKSNLVKGQRPNRNTTVDPNTRVYLTVYRYKKKASKKTPRAAMPPAVIPSPGGPIPVPHRNLPPVGRPRVGKPPAPRVRISSIRNPRAHNRSEVINWRLDNVLIIRGMNVNLPGNEIKGEGRTGYTLRRRQHPSCSVGPHCVALAVGLRKNLRYASVCGDRGRKRIVITEPSRRNAARGEFRIIWEPSDSPPKSVNLPRATAGSGGNIWMKMAARSVLAGRTLRKNKVRIFLRREFKTGGRPVSVMVRSNRKAVVVKPGYFPKVRGQQVELSFDLQISLPRGCKGIAEGVVKISAELRSQVGAKETAKAYLWVAQ